MNNLLYNSEKIPSDFEGIKYTIGNITYKNLDNNDLKNFRNFEELFGNKKCVILFLPNETDEIGHWTCMINHDKYIEFFDPYGYKYDALRNILHFNNTLENLINNSNKKIVFNKFRFQQIRENISTCARHVAVRCRLSSMLLDEYKNFIIHSHYKPDDLVTILTLLIIPKNQDIVPLIRKHI